MRFRAGATGERRLAPELEDSDGCWICLTSGIRGAINGMEFRLSGVIF